jgi:hypothetical protein
MKMEQIECSETSAYKIQTPGNHPEENIQLSTSLYVTILCYSAVRVGGSWYEVTTKSRWIE